MNTHRQYSRRSSSAYIQGSGRSIIEALETRTLFTVATLIGATQDLGGPVGSDAADPVRNVAYVYDQGHNHILAIDTTSGTTAAVCTPTANVAGLAVSVDDTRLFASEPGAFQIEVFSLPHLMLLKTLDVGVAVTQILAGANDRIIGATSGITGFNAQTGATLYSMPNDYDGLLRVNLSGTRLYTRAQGLSGNDGSIHVWDISGTGNPVAMNEIPGPTGANSTDFAVDESQDHAYMGDGGGDGIEVTLISTGHMTNWNFAGGGSVNGLAAFPGSDFVYATTFGGAIGRFNQNGVELAEWVPSLGVGGESLVVTPNGNLICTYGSGVNIVGISSLDITQTAAAQASATTLGVSSTTSIYGASVTLTATVASSPGGGQTPTGSVSFTDNGAVLGSAEVLSNGDSHLHNIFPPGRDQQHHRQLRRRRHLSK